MEQKWRPGQVENTQINTLSKFGFRYESRTSLPLKQSFWVVFSMLPQSSRAMLMRIDMTVWRIYNLPVIFFTCSSACWLYQPDKLLNPDKNVAESYWGEVCLICLFHHMVKGCISNHFTWNKFMLVLPHTELLQSGIASVRLRQTNHLFNEWVRQTQSLFWKLSIPD